MLTHDDNQKDSEVNPTNFNGMKCSEAHFVGWLKERTGIPIKATLSFCMPGKVKYFIDIESKKGVLGKERLELILDRAWKLKLSFKPTEVVLCLKVFSEYDGSFVDMDDEKKNQLVFNFLQKKVQKGTPRNTEGGDGRPQATDTTTNPVFSQINSIIIELNLLRDQEMERRNQETGWPEAESEGQAKFIQVYDKRFSDLKKEIKNALQFIE